MSLLVWLPLNGNLNNQGLSNSEFNLYNGDTYLSISSEGKIGKCYQRTGEGAGCYRSTEQWDLSEDITMMCWAYISGHTATVNGATANGLISMHSHADCTGIGITFKYISDSDYRISCNTGNGTNRTFHTYFGTTNIKNKWHHLCLTYNKTKNQHILYVDGNIEETINGYGNASKLDYFEIFNWSTTYHASQYLPSCRLNDVRLYDECLSQKEIREIAKCKILHYPMNEIDGVIGGRNLLKNSGTVITNNEYLTNRYQVTEVLEDGEVYTVAMCVTPAPNLEAWILYLSVGYTARVTLIPSGTNKQILTATFVAGYYTGMGPDDNIGYSNPCFYRFPNDGTITENSTIHWCKIVKGSDLKNASTWTPAPEDGLIACEMDNIVYDTSGFGYNGTMTSALAWDSDTAVGSGTYNFAGNKQIYISNLPTNGLSNSYTITWWAKTSTFAYKMFWGFANGNRLNLYGGIYCNTGDGHTNPFVTADGSAIPAPSINAWHHYAITGDGSSSKLYIDGVLRGTAIDYKPITGSIIYINGWENSTEYCFNGLLNDFRIYATALSDNDVKELYQTRMSLANNSTLFCTEYIEPDGVFGGRNYIQQSDLRAYVHYNSVPTINGNTISSTWNSSCTGNTFTLRMPNKLPTMPAGIWTWSGYLKVNNSIPASKYFIGLASSYGHTLIQNTYDNTTGYFIITQYYDGDETWLFHGATTRTSGSSDVVTITDLKLERGAIATPWSPAPEDGGANIVDIEASSPSFEKGGIVNGGLVETYTGKMQISENQVILNNLIEN